MQRTLLATLAALLVIAPGARAKDADLSLGAQLYTPVGGAYDLLDDGFGLEVGFRRWCSLPVGYQLSAGFVTCDAGDGSEVGSNLTDFSGDAVIVPIGLSGLYQIPESPVTLELGLRYALVESNLKAFNSDAKRQLDVEVDDGVFGVAALQTDWDLSGAWQLGVDVGTQFDLVKGDVKTDLGPAVDSELAGFFIRIALRCAL